MSIFKTHYDNSLVYVDTEWSTKSNPELDIRFSHGPFLMDYHGPQSAFIKDFKEDFTAFYEKVMKDYDEVTGRSNTLESCFDAMVDGMTEIDYRPEPKRKKIPYVTYKEMCERKKIPINFYEYVKEIKQGLELAGIKNFDICDDRFLVSKDDPYSGFDLMIWYTDCLRIINGRFG